MSEGGKERNKPVYMLDTGTCVSVLTQTDKDASRRLSRTSVGEVCISAVTLSELCFGLKMSRGREQDRAALELFLRHVTVLDYPSSAGKDYATIREALHWREAMIGSNELLIAAHAQSSGMTLVSTRMRELVKVPGFVGESW